MPRIVLTPEQIQAEAAHILSLPRDQVRDWLRQTDEELARREARRAKVHALQELGLDKKEAKALLKLVGGDVQLAVEAVLGDSPRAMKAEADAEAARKEAREAVPFQPSEHMPGATLQSERTDAVSLAPNPYPCRVPQWPQG
ncbi:unnamed protein product, partial [Symbiodinium sp. CCMP2456]